MCNSLLLAAPEDSYSNSRIVPRYSVGKSLHHQRSNVFDTRVEQLPESIVSKETEETHLSIERLREGLDLVSSKLPFLWKLHILLDDVEQTGDDSIISWMPNGNGFKVYRPKAFITRIAPHYFKQSKYKSFQRQLHLYEFTRTPYGPQAGSYSHPKFVRGNQNLCLCLSPIKIKGKNGRKNRTPVAVPSSQAMLPGKRYSQSRHVIKGSKTSSAAEILPSKDQCEWVEKIKKMMVNGAMLAAQLSQEERKRPEPSESLDGDDTCYAFGGAFHIVPGDDHLPFDNFCASDDEDDVDEMDAADYGHLSSAAE